MIFTYLLLLAPLSLVLAWLHAPPLWVFVTAAAAIVPLAEWIRRATEQMALRAGAVIGGLPNVTFGNTAEFISTTLSAACSPSRIRGGLTNG